MQLMRCIGQGSPEVTWRGYLILGKSSHRAIHTPIGRKPVVEIGHWEPWSRHIRRYLTQRSLWRDFLSHKSTYHFLPLCLSWVGIASTCNYGVNPFQFFLYLTTGLCVWSSPALRWGTSTAISASVWAFTSSPKSPSDTRREGNRCLKKASRPCWKRQDKWNGSSTSWGQSNICWLVYFVWIVFCGIDLYLKKAHKSCCIGNVTNFSSSPSMSSPKAYAAFLLSDYTDVRNVWTTQVGVKENAKGVLLFLFRGVTLFRSSTFEHYPFVGSDSDAFARKVARVLRTETQLVFVCLCICTILHDLYGVIR